MLVAEGEVTDEIYAQAGSRFSAKELVDLTLAVVVINDWNRPAVAFHAPRGTCQPEADRGG